ncbi:hypothetical protein [Rhizohabitans arisaemae]|uniref:hypothetical protein n=1 Tax=Rhizohabitans arisaemae TaxID=2720610 RepID=UPI0024B2381C|nr:hypothetical protein [Rhizohabitans arisaemae]
MKKRSLVMAAVLTLTVAGCGADPDPAADTVRRDRTPSPSGDPAAGLRRPWAVDRIEPRARCPVTVKTVRPDPGLGPLLGDGVAGPVGLQAGGVLEFVDPVAGSWTDQSWGGQKVLWAVDPAVTAPVLVRGRQLNGPGELAFNDPAVPELLLLPGKDTSSNAEGWRDYPGFTRLRGPGCYAYQVDTATETFTIVFRAVGPSISATVR